MKKAVVYIHGQGGNAKEADHYKALFRGWDVVGLDYTAQTPWEAKEEFPALLEPICREHGAVQMVANSIGAYFAMDALSGWPIERAWFISPVVNMERLITDMMAWAGVTEEELREKRESPPPLARPFPGTISAIQESTPSGGTFHPHFVRGKRYFDFLFHYLGFAEQIHADLTVMKDGEHWFHTPEQMQFLDDWVRRFLA